MFSKLRSRQALRGDRGAADPMLVVASIAVALILLLGGGFAVAHFINQSHDSNAKNDLGLVKVAEDSIFAAGDKYIEYKSPAITGSTTADQALENATIGFKPTDGEKLVVQVNTTGTPGSEWYAAVKSKANTGTIFIRTSKSNVTVASTDTAGLTKIGITTTQATKLVDAIK